MTELCVDLCIWNFFIYFINESNFTKLYQPATATSLDFVGSNPIEWIQKKNWFGLKRNPASYNPSFKQAVTDIVFNKVMKSFQGVYHDIQCKCYLLSILYSYRNVIW